jgi:predicted O-methyltransferase YrrM
MSKQPIVQIPDERRIISIKEHESHELREIIESHGFKKCLETGFAFGQSACHILSASTSPKLTSCDPFQTEEYHNIGLKNVEENGFNDRHSHIPKRSELALPELLEKGESYDFIFIDGDHKFDGAFIDFFYASKMIEKGGVIVFHDMWMRSLILVANYIRKNRTDFKPIKMKSSNMTAFQRIGDDERDGMVFQEFYTTRGMIKYHLNRMAWENKTLIGKLINKIKGHKRSS